MTTSRSGHGRPEHAQKAPVAFAYSPAPLEGTRAPVPTRLPGAPYPNLLFGQLQSKGEVSPIEPAGGRPAFVLPTTGRRQETTGTVEQRIRRSERELLGRNRGSHSGSSANS